MAYDNITIDDINDELASRNGNQLGQQYSIAKPEVSDSQPQGFVDKLASSPSIQGILGTGDALAKQMHNIANILPGVNIKDRPIGNPEDITYKVGSLMGNLAGYGGLGMLGGIGLEAAEALPGAIGAGAETLGGEGTLAGILRRVGGSTAFGSAMSPEDRVKGAEFGAGLGAVGEALPYVPVGVGKVTSFVRPKAILSDIISKFGKDAAEAKAASGSGQYENVFNEVPNKSIYDRSIKNDNTTVSDVLGGSLYNRGINSDLEQGPLKYTDLPSEQTSRIYDKGLKLLDRRFNENPTIRNAHSLQSELGGELRKLAIKESRLGRLDQSDIGIRDSFSFARDLLQNDIKSFLKSERPDLLPKYESANYNWASDVVPHQNAAKIISDLGQRITPEKSLSALRKAQDKNIPLPEDIGSSIDSLEKTIGRKTAFQRGVGGLTGLALAQSLGPVGELAGGAIGSYIAPSLMKTLSLPFSSAISKKAASSIYEPLRQITLSNILARGQ